MRPTRIVAATAALSLLLPLSAAHATVSTPARDGGFEPAQTVTTIDAFDSPRVAVNTTGVAAAVFYNATSWYAVTRLPGPDQQWSDPQPLDLAPGGHTYPIATWPDGRLTFYADRDRRILTMASDGTFGSSDQVPYGRTGIGSFAGSGAGLDDGRLVLAGHAAGGVRALVRGTGGGWSRSEKLRVPHTFVRGVWEEPDGTVQVAVVRPRAPRHDTGPELFSVVLRADGTWGHRQDVAIETVGRYGDGRFLSFDSNAEGDASLLWGEYDQPRGNPKAVVSIHPADGDWSAPSALQSNRVANYVQALRPDGTALVATVSDSDSSPDAGKLVADTVAPDGTRLDREIVYDGEFQYIVITVGIGDDAAGRVVLQFNTRVGNHDRRERYVRCDPGAECVPVGSFSGDWDLWRAMAVTADGALLVLGRETPYCATSAEYCSRRLPTPPV